MYLNKQKKPNGDIYLSIREKYHVPQKGSRERTIESLGYLSELKKKYDDPIAFFTQKAKKMTEEKKTINPLECPLIVMPKCPFKPMISKMSAMLSLRNCINN